MLDEYSVELYYAIVNLCMCMWLCQLMPYMYSTASTFWGMMLGEYSVEVEAALCHRPSTAAWSM